MKQLLYLLPFLLLWSCGSTPPVIPIHEVKPINVKPIKQSVVIVKEYTNKALTEIALAKKAAEDARNDAEEAKILVEEMRLAQSPFMEQVAELRSSYEEQIDNLVIYIDEINATLKAQAVELSKTDDELDKAMKAAAVANQANELLISSNKTLKKKADDGAKYKDHWNTRWERKIKTIGWTVGITTLVIFLLIMWQRLQPSGVAASFAGRLLNARR